MNSIQILEKLISFNTVSSNSNLDIISYCEKILKDAQSNDQGQEQEKKEIKKKSTTTSAKEKKTATKMNNKNGKI